MHMLEMYIFVCVGGGGGGGIPSWFTDVEIVVYQKLLWCSQMKMNTRLPSFRAS